MSYVWSVPTTNGSAKSKIAAIVDETGLHQVRVPSASKEYVPLRSWRVTLSSEELVIERP